MQIPPFPQRVLQDIQRAADQAFPCESCGLVVWQAGELVYVPMRNLATAEDQFHIDPAGLLPYVLEPGCIACFCHSHPTAAAIPSAQDIAGHTYEEPHLIYSVRDREMRLYDVQHGTWQEIWRVQF